MLYKLLGERDVAGTDRGNQRAYRRAYIVQATGHESIEILGSLFRGKLVMNTLNRIFGVNLFTLASYQNCGFAGIL